VLRHHSLHDLAGVLTIVFACERRQSVPGAAIKLLLAQRGHRHLEGAGEVRVGPCYVRREHEGSVHRDGSRL